jgi:hypothetical protein
MLKRTFANFKFKIYKFVKLVYKFRITINKLIYSH